ncbi:MAG TPA: hypothetical protein VKB75_08655, partial [Jatrophihabitans sp.]|nr:hypothetical protein [Jatrophihabitans sp.]
MTSASVLARRWPAATVFTGAPLRTPRFDGAWRYRLASVACVLVALGAGTACAVRPRLALVLALCLIVFVLVSLYPALGGYLLIGLTPLIAGIDRGNAVPVLRPSEALALAIGLALTTGALLRRRTGAAQPVRLSRPEAALIAIAVCNSIVPMLWMLARGEAIARDDLLYALVMWKFAGIYLIVRVSITNRAQVMRCLWISVCVGAVVGAIAIMQSLNKFGVSHFLATYYAPFGYTGAVQHARGSSTLALPAATADLMIYNLAVLAGLWIVAPRWRALLGPLGLLFILGALSAGEFSSAIGLVIGICAIAVITSYPRLLSIFVPIAGIAFIVLRPVIATRLQGFQSLSGLPVSWTGRLNNLHNYFWPKLFSDWNYVLGVRPSARVPVAYQATGYVWIESGYTWLLWGGGIPLFAAFVWFVSATLRSSWVETRRRFQPLNVAALATFVGVIVMTFL